MRKKSILKELAHLLVGGDRYTGESFTKERVISLMSPIPPTKIIAQDGPEQVVSGYTHPQVVMEATKQISADLMN